MALKYCKIGVDVEIVTSLRLYNLINYHCLSIFTTLQPAYKMFYVCYLLYIESR